MNAGTSGYHDPLGLFWYASWLGGHGFFVSLFLTLLLAPVAMMLIAPIFETRLLPLGKAQFDGFFPGTIFLAIGTAILLSIASDFPPEAHWYNSFWWHFAVQAATIKVAERTLLVETDGRIARDGFTITDRKVRIGS